MNIPKIIHFIWAGGVKLMPDKNIEVMISWKKENPDFAIWLWVDKKTYKETDENENLRTLRQYYQKKFQYFIQKEQIIDELQIKDITEEGISDEHVRYEIDKLLPNYGASSDILRYKILYRYGGAYFDTDVAPPINENNEFIKPITLTELLTKYEDADHILHISYIDHLPQRPNQNVRIDDLQKFQINSEASLGNDAFVCSENNPLMNLIYQECISNYNLLDLATKLNQTNDEFCKIKEFHYEKTLIRMCYGSNNRLYHTLQMTGPSHVKRVIREKRDENTQTFKLAQDEEFKEETEIIYRKKVFGNNVHIVPLRTLSYVAIAPFEINTLNWLQVSPQKTDDIEKIVKKILGEIEFEVEHFKILRLDDHMEILLNTTVGYEEANIINNLLRFVSELDLSKVEIIQQTCRFQKVNDFYESKSLLNKSYLNKDTELCLISEVIYSALNLREFIDVKNDFENEKCKDFYTIVRLKEIIRFVKNGFLCFIGLIGKEWLIDNDILWENIKTYKETIETIVSKIGFYADFDDNPDVFEFVKESKDELLPLINQKLYEYKGKNPSGYNKIFKN